MTLTELHDRHYWIFDMDGTLTLAIHDFEAIREQLGLPAGRPILESLALLPEKQAQPLRQQLDAIELEIAHQSTAAPGALALLAQLVERNIKIGILTRNNRVNIQATLQAAGLAHFFPEALTLSRDCAPPKPSPEGIHQLLRLWHANPTQAVMLGDHRFDLETGRAAGTATVHIDPQGEFAWPELTDLGVQSLTELVDSQPI